MDFTKKTWAIALLAGIAILIIVIIGYLSIKEDGGHGGGNGPDKPEDKGEEVIRKTVKESAVARIVPRVMKAEFDLAGRGECGDWGVTGVANFKYTVIVVAESRIDSKEALPGGEIKVTETRTFTTVQDALTISDVDMKFDISLLPVKEFSAAIDWAVCGWGMLTGNVLSGGAITVGKNYVKTLLQEVDGTSVRSLLGAVGYQPTAEVERKLNQIVQSVALRTFGGLRSISKKSYKITYYQKSSGEPMYVKFTYSDGRPVTEDEEKMVLRRVNAFIDYNLVPNRDCVPGQSWNIQAADMQEVFDPYADGSYIGEIRATRKANNEKGEWVIALSPATIDIVNGASNTTGHMNLSRGTAYVNPEVVSVNELSVAGTAQGQQVNKHHLLFKAKVAGECDFTGKVVTTLMDNE